MKNTLGKNLRIIILFFIAGLAGCTGLPKGVTVVKGFEPVRYLGKWYEIARLDHSFEKGLERVTANYSFRKDGGIKVLNKGFNPENKKWKDAEGKAFFIDDTATGRLKVSFFWPFYASYNIIALDTINYSYSMVCGPDKTYLWILSRTPNMPDSTKSALIQKAESLGFDTSKLIFVKQ